MEEHNLKFKEKVLENPMFDCDKLIIQTHLSNFYCVFQLGFDAGKEIGLRELQDDNSHLRTENQELRHFKKHMEEILLNTIIKDILPLQEMFKEE